MIKQRPRPGEGTVEEKRRTTNASTLNRPNYAAASNRAIRGRENARERRRFALFLRFFPRYGTLLLAALIRLDSPVSTVTAFSESPPRGRSSPLVERRYPSAMGSPFREFIIELLRRLVAARNRLSCFSAGMARRRTCCVGASIKVLRYFQRSYETLRMQLC